MSEKPLRSVFEVYSVILFRGCWKKKITTFPLWIYINAALNAISYSATYLHSIFPLKKRADSFPAGLLFKAAGEKPLAAAERWGEGGDKEWRLLLSAGTSSKWIHLTVWSPLGSLLLSLRSSSVAGRQTAYAKPSADILQLERCTAGPLKAGHLCDRNVWLYFSPDW